MTAQTFKYTHVHNCPAKRFTPPTEPIITQSTEPDMTKPNEPEISYDFEPVLRQPTAREIRAVKRDAMVKTLMSQAF